MATTTMPEKHVSLPDLRARKFGSIRTCYVNFAEHLLNAYSPNVASPVNI